MMNVTNNYRKLAFAMIFCCIMSVPFVVNAASEKIVTNSAGWFEYDFTGDNKPDIVLDSEDIDTLNQSENTNVSDILLLQAKYNDLLTTLNAISATDASGTFSIISK